MSQTAIETQGFVLHSRAFQENSLTLQLFTLDYGFISAIGKGIKSKKSQARKALLQPFNLLNFVLAGRGNLKTITQVDASELLLTNTFVNAPKAMACGYYCNELLTRCLPEQQEFPEVFGAYKETLIALSTTQELEELHGQLRRFEMYLLKQLGHAPDFNFDTQGKPINAECFYQLFPDSGFQLTAAPLRGNLVSGAAIIGLANNQISTKIATESKLVMQLLLRQVIGNRPLQSRKMWQHIRD
ncbi:DNA repair protein RecO [Aliikangiella sp. IMCC44653]